MMRLFITLYDPMSPTMTKISILDLVFFVGAPRARKYGGISNTSPLGLLGLHGYVIVGLASRRASPVINMVLDKSGHDAMGKR